MIILLSIIAMLGAVWNDEGWLGHEKSITYAWTPTADKPFVVNVEAQGGDIDCYLLHHNADGSGWVIWQMDERPVNACNFAADQVSGEPLRLWIHNQAKDNAHFQVHVR